MQYLLCDDKKQKRLELCTGISIKQSNNYYISKQKHPRYNHTHTPPLNECHLNSNWQRNHHRENQVATTHNQPK